MKAKKNETGAQRAAEASFDQQADKPNYAIDTRKAGRLAAILAVLITVIWAGLAAAVLREETFLTGTYGDSFGMLTALFTGLALAGLFYTIRLQRIELAETRDVLQEQSDSLKQQLFEGTFFQLTKRLNDALDDVSFAGKTGRRAIKTIYEAFGNQLLMSISRKDINDPRSVDFVLNEFALVLQDQQAELRHYFRLLYHLFKFIYTSGLPEHVQARYANLARAQLSTYELCLLFYNSLTGEGAEGMKPLVVHFGLLKHLDPSLLMTEKHRTEFGLIDERAFMGYADRKNHAH